MTDLSSLISRVEEGFELASASVRPEPIARVSKRQAKVLKALSDVDCEDYAYLNFKGIERRANIEPCNVRRTVRALARKGFAEFGKGLWTDEGMPAGSGYRITKAGRSALSSLENSPAGLADAHKKDRP